ncbi:MAG: hypothetical protein KC470_11640, partial [Dehalococcoidia bacterium]|nr:hypothetical protein [Dehalococcoidia bacterium]
TATTTRTQPGHRKQNDYANPPHVSHRNTGNHRAVDHELEQGLGGGGGVPRDYLSRTVAGSTISLQGRRTWPVVLGDAGDFPEVGDRFHHLLGPFGTYPREGL